MKQVYELNLPSFKDLFLESFSGYNDSKLVHNYIIENDITNIVKPEWRNFLNLTWDKLLYFKKQDFKGSIHTDSVLFEKNRHLNNPVWGINYIESGESVIEFWNWEDVQNIGYTDPSYNNSNVGRVSSYRPLKICFESHKMIENKVYLVNATLPHRVTGIGNRKAYSLRVANYDLSWDKVIDLFKNYIVT